VRDEAELYRAVDLDFIRGTTGEWGEFESGRDAFSAKLVEKENCGARFIVTTTASDGHNSLEEMAEAAQALGLEYLGIADHSRSQIQAHGLDEKKLLAQSRRDSKAKTKSSTASISLLESNATFFATVRLIFPMKFCRNSISVVASVHSALSERSGHDKTHDSRDGESVRHDAGAPDRSFAFENASLTNRCSQNSRCCCAHRIMD